MSELAATVQIDTDITVTVTIDQNVTATIGGSNDMTILNEAPTGTQDGVNKTFSTANPYTAGTLVVVLNGVEYSIHSGNITEDSPGTGAFSWTGDAPQVDDVQFVHYIKQ